MGYTFNRCCCKYDISDGTKLIGMVQLLVFVFNLVICLVWADYEQLWQPLFPLMTFAVFIMQ